MELYNEDCFDRLEKIPDSSIDLVLTDPPYGITRLDYDKAIDIERLFENLLRVIKPNGVIAIFGAEPFSSQMRIRFHKFWKYDWIWQKTVCTGFLNAKKRPLRSYEICSIFYRKSPKYYPQMWKSKSARIGHCRRGSGSASHYRNYAKVGYSYTETNLRYPVDILRFPNAHGNNLPRDLRKLKWHPSAKPIALCEYFIRTYSDPGDIILDPFMGGGSIACAALRSNRDYIGIEISPTYFSMAQYNFDAFKNQNENIDNE